MINGEDSSGNSYVLVLMLGGGGHATGDAV